MSQPKLHNTDKGRDPQQSTSHVPEENGNLPHDASITSLQDGYNKYIEMRGSTDYQNYPGTETDHFEYAERYGIHKTTLTESIAHLIKGVLGAGVLTMHEAYKYGGLWTSLGTTFGIGFMNSYTMFMLTKSAHIMYKRLRISQLSYPELAEAAAATGTWKCFRKCSKGFRYLVEVCIVLSMCGTCCIYQIMIANTFHQVLDNWNTQIDSIRLNILCSTPLLLCLSAIRTLKFLAPFSMIADIFVAMCVLATLYYSLQTGENIANRPAWSNFPDFIKFVGICVYCTCGATLVLPIENNMRQPIFFSFVLCWAMGIVMVLTTVTGFFGYWGWGESCQSPITVHMPVNTFTAVLQALLCVMLSVTFVVQFWVPCSIIWHYLSRRHKGHSYNKMIVLERIYRVLLAAVITCVSIIFPNLIPVMAFIGHFFMGFIAFVIPAFIESLITWDDHTPGKIRWRFVKNSLFMVFGVFLSGSAFYSLHA